MCLLSRGRDGAVNAARIEQALAEAEYRAVVIYSDRDDNVVPNQSCIRVPDTFFFGQKFKSIIHRFDSQILLIIAADVLSHDWGTFVRGSSVLRIKDIQIWGFRQPLDPLLDLDVVAFNGRN